jgi:succinylglutamate desuccinylase
MAYSLNQRYYQTDLNRCGKGNSTSTVYEEQRATEIQDIAKTYTYTIDLHGTYQDTGTFLLITNPTKENFRLASFFDIETVVIWPSITKEMQYPMSEFFPCGIEIEVGSQTEEKSCQTLVATLSTYLTNLDTYENENDTIWQARLFNKRIYEMYGEVSRDEQIPITLLKEQVECTWNKETFTPIFIGTYEYKNTIAYKLRKLPKESCKSKFLI